MRARAISLVISVVLGVVSGSVSILAQSVAGNNTNTSTPQSGWLKNFTIESFGYSLTTP
jgi:hypothetical protein